MAGLLDTIALNIPLLCNRERVDSEVEDKLVIGVTVRMGQVLRSIWGIGDDLSFTAILKTASPREEKTVSQVFTIVSPIDIGQLVNLLSISQSNQTEFKKTISRAEDLRLHWSIDGVNFYTATLRLNKHYNGSQVNYIQVYPYEPPLLTRYFSVILSTQDACHLPFLPHISYDLPVLHGPVNKTEHVVNELAHTVSRGDETCMVIAEPGSTARMPYLWVEFKTSMFGISETGPFIVYLAGYGLNCGERNGSQVIMVVYPKQTLRMDGENHQRLCDNFKTNEDFPNYPGYLSCSFICDCSGTEECGRFTLLIMNMGTQEETNSLCRVMMFPPHYPV